MWWHGSVCKWSEVWSEGMGEKEYSEVVWPPERMKSEEFVKKKVYMSDNEGPNRGGRPLGR